MTPRNEAISLRTHRAPALSNPSAAPDKTASDLTTTAPAPQPLNAALLNNAQLNGPFSRTLQEQANQLLSQAIQKLTDLNKPTPRNCKDAPGTSSQRIAQIALITRYRAILAPHKALPPEILASVFLACAEGPRDRRCTYAHVCRAWRQIALGTPGLWNRVWVDYLHCEREREQTMMARELISRSGGLPIDLTLSVGPRISRWSATYEADLLDIITSNSARLGSLSLSLPGKCSLVPRLLRLPPGRFGQLEALKIYAGSIWTLETKADGHAEPTAIDDPTTAPGILAFSTAPNLRSLEFFSPFHTWGTGRTPPFHAPWAQLTTLKLLIRVTTNAAHHILAQCTVLETCKIMVVDNPQSEPNTFPAYSDTITLRNLRVFTVQARFVEDDCAAFMKPFVLPASTVLSCDRWNPSMGATPRRRFAPW